jgi:hypothetical protein
LPRSLAQQALKTSTVVGFFIQCSKDTERGISDIGFSVGNTEYVKLREDELKEAPQEIIDILENKKPEE